MRDGNQLLCAAFTWEAGKGAPVNGAAVDEGGDLPAARAKSLANGAHAEQDVQVVADLPSSIHRTSTHRNEQDKLYNIRYEI